MSKPETLAALAALQAEFGAMLRSPLDRSTGTLRARSEAYAPELCAQVAAGPHNDARARLAVYNRQYWFRLFNVLQREYLLSARLVGAWHFNELAARYLGLHPPAHYDLQQLCPGFLDFLVSELAPSGFAAVPRELLLEAAALDHAVSRVFLAPRQPAFDPAILQAADLSSVRLQQARSVAFLCEHWPLLALRRRTQQEPAEAELKQPARLATAQHWLIFRKGSGHAFVQLPARAFRLFTLLAEHSVAHALHTLETECPVEERAALPARVQGWLRDGVRSGFWVAP